jgi:hypothetical protein
MELVLDVKRNGESQSLFESKLLAEVNEAMCKVREAMDQPNGDGVETQRDIPIGSEVEFDYRGGILLKCSDELDGCIVRNILGLIPGVTRIDRMG